MLTYKLWSPTKDASTQELKVVQVIFDIAYAPEIHEAETYMQAVSVVEGQDAEITQLCVFIPCSLAMWEVAISLYQFCFHLHTLSIQTSMRIGSLFVECKVVSSWSMQVQ